jgi:uncharacterized protein YodC (DUF2158 family)
MTTPEFKPGDLVRLKSGGPVLIVDDVDDIGFVQCVWFGGPLCDEHHTASFHPAVLAPVSPDNRPLPQL